MRCPSCNKQATHIQKWLHSPNCFQCNGCWSSIKTPWLKLALPTVLWLGLCLLGFILCAKLEHTSHRFLAWIWICLALIIGGPIIGWITWLVTPGVLTGYRQQASHYLPRPQRATSAASVNATADSNKSQDSHRAA